jgi:flagellar hook-associated protein 1 FlgK
MTNLFALYNSSSQALTAFQNAIGVSSNNVSNASTAGYADQSVDFTSVSSADGGGVETGPSISSRDQAAEQAVRTQTEQLGYQSQLSTNLNNIQSTFDITGNSGIDAAMSSLLSSFSAWSAAPTDGSQQQAVLNSAQSVAQSLNAASTTLSQASSQANSDIQSTLTQINSLSDQIASINGQIRDGGTNAGLDAQMNSSLEQLSKLTGYTTLQQSDGTVNVMLGGQSSLVEGSQATHLSMKPNPAASPAFAGGNPPDQIVDSNGNDVTALSTGGQLGALVDFHNTTLAGLIGDGTQQGTLNVLAKGIADTVNTLLTSGQTSTGASGVALFSYNAAGGSTVAGSLTVNPSITTGQLAAAAPGPPVVANGTALALANLSNPTSASQMIDGQSMTAYYSSIAQDIGTQTSNAQAATNSQTQLVTQAQNLRTQVSGVSLDTEAALMMQYQRGYQAASRVFSIVDQMAETVINMVGGSAVS